MPALPWNPPPEPIATTEPRERYAAWERALAARQNDRGPAPVSKGVAWELLGAIALVATGWYFLAAGAFGWWPLS